MKGFMSCKGEAKELTAAGAERLKRSLRSLAGSLFLSLALARADFITLVHVISILSSKAQRWAEKPISGNFLS